MFPWNPIRLKTSQKRNKKERKSKGRGSLEREREGGVPGGKTLDVSRGLQGELFAY